MGEKFHTFYEKIVEYDRVSEDIVKYVFDADKVTGYFDKTKVSLKPFEQILAEIVKKFEVSYCYDILVLLMGTINHYF